MEDNNHALLMKVLHHHFHERPNVLEQAMREINNYSKNANKFEYEETLNKLYNLMSDDLPSKILLYFLTMVPLPTQENCQSNVMELMKKTHDSLPENIRPVLLDYLKSKSPTVSSPKRLKLDVEQEDKNISNTNNDNICEKTEVDKHIRNEQIKVCKKLVDICAEYIFANENKLKKTYEEKHVETWKIINDGLSQDLQQCYEVVKDVNKKRKWLRMLEDEEITIEVFHEEYKDSSILLQSHLSGNIYDEDPLSVSKKLQDVVMNFVNSTN